MIGVGGVRDLAEAVHHSARPSGGPTIASLASARSYRCVVRFLRILGADERALLTDVVLTGIAVSRYAKARGISPKPIMAALIAVLDKLATFYGAEVRNIQRQEHVAA